MPLNPLNQINPPPNRPTLEGLVASDPDGDVKYYAALALEGKDSESPGPPSAPSAAAVAAAVAARG